MADREKLIELLGDNVCETPDCEECKYSMTDDACVLHMKQRMADHLIANGVTVQEWIPVTERLPENEQWVLCFMQNEDFGTFRVFQWSYIDWQWNDGNEWYDEKDVTHWMPLPEPPKGE